MLTQLKRPRHKILKTYRATINPGLSMSIASANIQICRAVRDLVYCTSLKRNQDRLSLCVESVTRSSSQLRDLLLNHEFITKSSQDTNIQPNTSSPPEHQFVRMSEGENQLDSSRSLSRGRKDGSLSPKQTINISRLSSERERTKDLIAIGDFHVIDSNDFDRSSTDLALQLSSLSVDVTIDDIQSDDQLRLSSTNHLSPSSFLSSPMSTSSLSLSSNSSFNVDSMYFVEEHSATNEVKEPALSNECQ